MKKEIRQRETEKRADKAFGKQWEWCEGAPEVFVCPISREPMRDPVTLCTGQTYDRSSILTWLASGGLTCPATNTPLSDTSLTPNSTLRRLIQSHFSQNSLSTSASLLVHRLKVAKRRPHRISALSSLLSLARSHEEAMEVLANLDVPSLLAQSLTPLTPPSVAALSADLLSLLPLNPDVLSLLRHPDAFSLLVDLLHEAPAASQVAAASVLHSAIATAPPDFGSVSSFRLLFGALRLARSPRSESFSAGVRLLHAVCRWAEARTLLMRAGAIPCLLDILPVAEGADAQTCMEVLEQLSKEGAEALRSCERAVPNIVNTLMRVSERCTALGLSVLLRLCTHGAGIGMEAKLAAKLLLILQSTCEPAVKQRARNLLKLCSRGHGEGLSMFASKCGLDLSYTIH
ncbi:U-box domain-containing protein 75 [Amborella trichopoda]|uniref:U-box domain-containing protein n=1 Tax=Amborella trichopoda TaxID=13333 RepID=W1NKH9_AMBTC|nr:U-box domain-containing protein 75 [Amborella trichopoda]ERM96322.1 hypothetical protein AMTR_s00001p00199950 [Amborella trichopoda]|eukprot:XP_006828906.1 U-box domain-containing protein 75 [Amborella trichopoda]